MRFTSLIRSLFSFFSLISLAYAQTWALWLDAINILDNTDTFGDQIYFFILQKNNAEPIAYASLPEFPFSYTEENLKHFEPSILWEGNLPQKDKMSLVLSLVDREALPWLADEILGNIEISIANQGQGLSIQWNALTPSVSFDSNQDAPLAQRVYIEQNGGKYNFDLSWKPVENAS